MSGDDGDGGNGYTFAFTSEPFDVGAVIAKCQADALRVAAARAAAFDPLPSVIAMTAAERDALLSTIELERMEDGTYGAAPRYELVGGVTVAVVVSREDLERVPKPCLVTEAASRLK